MTVHTEDQLINGPDGKPAFVVVPYEKYLSRQLPMTEPTIPHAVVSALVDGATPIRAWREHLGLTQTDVAQRMGVSQSAYAQTEAATKPRQTTLERVATALELDRRQLDI